VVITRVPEVSSFSRPYVSIDGDRLRLSTYNVNDKLPPTETTELASVVGQGEEDILVFGFQEVDLRSAALLVSQGTTRAYEWEAALLRGLGDKAGEYERVSGRSSHLSR
jgi:hypothetical protein